MSTDPREADLVRRFQEGDLEAADALARKYTRVTVGLIYSSIGAVQESDDLVQEVFLEAQKSVKRLRDPARFPSWLYKITRRVCNRWVREHRRAPQHLETPEEVEQPPESEQSAGPTPGEIRRIVDRMPQALREVVYMRYFDSLSYERMAALLGISPSAINARLMKARKLLRSRLAPGIDRD